MFNLLHFDLTKNCRNEVFAQERSLNFIAPQFHAFFTLEKTIWGAHYCSSSLSIAVGWLTWFSPTAVNWNQVIRGPLFLPLDSLQTVNINVNAAVQLQTSGNRFRRNSQRFNPGVCTMHTRRCFWLFSGGHVATVASNSSAKVTLLRRCALALWT